MCINHHRTSSASILDQASLFVPIHIITCIREDSRLLVTMATESETWLQRGVQQTVAIKAKHIVKPPTNKITHETDVPSETPPDLVAFRPAERKKRKRSPCASPRPKRESGVHLFLRGVPRSLSRLCHHGGRRGSGSGVGHLHRLR